MNNREVIEVLREVSGRLCTDPDGYGQLAFVQIDRRGRKIVRESEVRSILTGVLAERGIKFGLEVPTRRKYRWSGRKSDRATTDLVVEPAKEPTNFELKARAIAAKGDFRHLRQDMMKLLGEPVPGAAVYHVVERATLDRVLRGYRQAYTDAKTQMTRLKALKRKWFVLSVLDRRGKRWIWRSAESMTEIDDSFFDRGGFSEEEVP